MKLHLPKSLLCAVLAVYTGYNTAAMGEVTTVTEDTTVTSLPAGYTGIIVNGGTLDFGSTQAGTLADGIIINNGGTIIYSGTTQTTFANATDVTINGGGKLILTGSNDGLGWNPGTVKSLTLEGTAENTAQLLTKGRITLDTTINMSGYATIGKTEDAATIGNDRASLDSWANNKLVISGEQNTINVDFILRRQLQIELNNGNLTVNGAVAQGSTGEKSVNIAAAENATIGGTVTFTGDFNSAGLTIGNLTTVNLNGNITSAITNNGSLNIGGTLNLSGIQGLSNVTLTGVSTNTNGFLSSIDFTNAITGTGNTTIIEGATITYLGHTFTATSATGNTITATADNKIYVVNENTLYDDSTMSAATTFLVQNEATFDANGGADVLKDKGVILTEGATLTNTGDEIGNGKAQLKDLILFGDAKVNGTNRFGLLAGNWGNTGLQLNGLTLTKEGNSIFHLYNTSISSGTIDVQEGTLEISGGNTNINGTAFKIAEDAVVRLYHFGSASGLNMAEAGEVILNATGTGTIQVEGETLITGTNNNTAAAVSNFAGEIEVKSHTLHLADSDNEYNAASLKMTQATINMMGGALRVFGDNIEVGAIKVDNGDNRTNITLHQTKTEQGGHGLYVGKLTLDSALNLQANWGSYATIAELAGSADINTKYNAEEGNTGNLNLSINKITDDYTGNLYLGANTDGTADEKAAQVNTAIGSYDSKSSISGKITNYGNLTITNAEIAQAIELGSSATLNLNGAFEINNSFTGGEVTYTDVDNTTASGNGYLTSAIYTDIVTGDGKNNGVTLGEDFTLVKNGATYSGATYSNGTISLTTNAKDIYHVNNGEVSSTAKAANAYAVAQGGTLNIDDESNAATLLSTATGNGDIKLSVTTTLKDSTKTVGNGKLTIAGVTLTLGTGDAQQNSISSFNTIELDGGTIYYENEQDIFHNLTVTSQGGTIESFDMGNETGEELRLADTTTLNGNLTYTNTWNSQVVIEQLSGNGNLIIDGTNRNSQNTSTFTINSANNFTGKVELINSYSYLTLNVLENAGVTVHYNGNKEQALNLTSIGAGNTIKFTGTTGYLATNPERNSNNPIIIGANLELSNDNGAALELVNGYSDYNYYFTGDVKGDGNILFNVTNSGPANITLTFKGDVQNWTGRLFVANNKSHNFVFTENATVINNYEIGAQKGATANVSFNHTQAATINSTLTNTVYAATSGTLNVTVANSSTAGTTFTKSINANAFEITQGTKATLTDNATIGNLKGAGNLFIAPAGETDSKTINLTVGAHTGRINLADTNRLTANITVNESQTAKIDGVRSLTNTTLNLTLNNGASLLGDMTGDDRTITINNLKVKGTGTLGTAANSTDPYKGYQGEFNLYNLSNDTTDNVQDTIVLASNSNTTKTTVFNLESGNFDGIIKVESKNTGDNRRVALNLNSATAAQNAVIELATSSGSSNDNDQAALAVTQDTTVRGIKGTDTSGYIIAGEAGTALDKASFSSTADKSITLTVNTNGGTYSSAAVVSDNLNLTKDGEGTQTFNGDTTAFNGAVNVQNGALAFGDSSLSVSSADVSAGAELSYGSGKLSISGNGAKASTGSISFDSTDSGVSLNGGETGADITHALLALKEGVSLQLNNLHLAQGTAVVGTAVDTAQVRSTSVGNNVTLVNTTVQVAAPTVLNERSGELSADIATELGVLTNIKGYEVVDSTFRNITISGELGLNFTADFIDMLTADACYIALSFDNTQIETLSVTASMDNYREIESIFVADSTIYVAIAAIPEPSTATLSLLALAALASRRRRK